jgi:hypothetical protein
MQIFWVSGPVGKIRRVNLTLKHLLMGAAIFTISLIFFGVILQYLGFQMAIEYNPQLARKLGNVHTALELENLNSFYRNKLLEIEKQVSSYQNKILDLEASNQKLVLLATPPSFQKVKPKSPSIGGPFIAPNHLTENPSLMMAMQEALQKIKYDNDQLETINQSWQQQVAWINTKPTGFPVIGHISVSSGFGKRIDPFNNSWSEHLGLDFQAPSGTAIVAAGSGIVKKAARDPFYGNLIVIDHGNGIESRYAHGSELLAQEGARVQRGQSIARIGSTGRATGPHLHFEVLVDGKLIDPMNILISGPVVK